MAKANCYVVTCDNQDFLPIGKPDKIQYVSNLLGVQYKTHFVKLQTNLTYMNVLSEQNLFIGQRLTVNIGSFILMKVKSLSKTQIKLSSLLPENKLLSYIKP